MDIRRLILLTIFFFSLYLIWDAWGKYNQPKSAQVAGSSGIADASSVPVPLAADGTIAAAKPLAPSDAAIPAAPTATQGETIQLETDLFKVKVSTRGGDITELILSRYNNPEDKSKPFALFGSEHKYKAQNGLTGSPGVTLPDHNTLYTVAPGKRNLDAGEKELTLRLDAPANSQGITVTKIYTFHAGSYLIDVRYEIDNKSTVTLTPSAYFQLRRDGKSPSGETSMVSTFTGPAVYTQADKYHKISFADIDKDKVKFADKEDNGWVAMVQHFFVSAWIPVPETVRKFYVRKIESQGEFLYDAGFIMPVGQVAPNTKTNFSVALFAGPQIQSELKQLAKPVADKGIGAEGLPLVVDYGWLTIIAAPIFWSLEAIYNVVGNWGWSIILLTICIKAIFFPLSAASYKSMAKMRTMTPRLTALRERCGNDKQRLNTEMMQLYKTEKINPLGGCLPIVIQIPVFIALYWALLGAVEMRDAPWVLWIHDLSAQDPYYILPVVMMATMLIQTKLNPTPPDPIQAKVAMIMPFAFGIMFFFFPSGLVLYWVVNNVLSIAQQWQITRMIEKGSQAANDPKAGKLTASTPSSPSATDGKKD